MLAQQVYHGIAVLILMPWILAILAGLLAVGISFTRARNSWIVLVPALFAVVYGIVLTVTQFVGTSGIAPIHFISVVPIILGGLAIWRFDWSKWTQGKLG